MPAACPSACSSSPARGPRRGCSEWRGRTSARRHGTTGGQADRNAGELGDRLTGGGRAEDEDSQQGEERREDEKAAAAGDRASRELAPPARTTAGAVELRVADREAATHERVDEVD